MANIGKAMFAGLAATVVLSVLMVMKAMMGVMPALNLPKMIAGMMGSPDTPILGWAIHFMIGVVVYGIAVKLNTLNGLLDQFNQAGIAVATVSADPTGKAEAEVAECGWKFPVGYGLSVDEMRRRRPTGPSPSRRCS